MPDVKNKSEDDEMLDLDKASTMNIKGESKFKIEMNSVKNLKGKKYFVKNHFKTQYGEGEPFEEEEILAFHES
jgi:hypothetical protein